MTMRKNAVLVFFAILVLFAACSKEKEERHKIAVVNDAPIYLDDFHKEIAIASQRDPAFSVTSGSLKATLDKMIEKRLLIQQANEKGITEDKRFIEAIKTFWEQTLIQRLMEELSAELAEKIYVTDDEVNRHYERMKSRITVSTVRSADESKALKVKAILEDGQSVPGAELLGPFLLEDIQPSNPIYNAFDLEAGKAGVWKDAGAAGGFVAALVVKKEPVKAPPFDEVRQHIKAELLERNRQEAISAWLKGVKEAARVEIDSKLLERIADE